MVQILFFGQWIHGRCIEKEGQAGTVQDALTTFRELIQWVMWVILDIHEGCVSGIS